MLNGDTSAKNYIFAHSPVLVKLALPGLLSGPLVKYATSEPSSTPNTPAHNTPTHVHTLEQPAPTNTPLESHTSDIDNNQTDSQEKNSILSLKTGRNLLKAIDIAIHLWLLHSPPRFTFTNSVITAGLLGTTATLAESIVKSYEAPNKQRGIIRSRVFVVSKLLGVLGNILLARQEDIVDLAFLLPNLAFPSHSLYGDYKTYLTNKDNSKKS